MSAKPNDDNFDWFDFLKLDIDQLSEDDFKAAVEMSGQWVTCACGQLCKSLPKYGPNNEPRDEELYDLGMNFMYGVKKLSDLRDTYFSSEKEEYLLQKFYKTRLLLNTILCSIEARSSHLLKIQNEQTATN